VLSRPGAVVPDPDLREYRRGLALSAISERASRTNLNLGPSKPIQRRENRKPLFAIDDDEDGEWMPGGQDTFDVNLDDDPELAFAIQKSLDHEAAPVLVDASPAAKTRSLAAVNAKSSRSTSGSAHPTTPPRRTSKHADLDSDDDDIYASPTRLETALSFANARPSQRPNISPQASMFGKPALLAVSHPTSPMSLQVPIAQKSDSDDDMEEIVPAQSSIYSSMQPPIHTHSRPSTVVSVPRVDSDDDMEEVYVSRSKTQPFGTDMTTERQQLPRARSQSPAFLQDASPVNLYNLTSQSPLIRRVASTALELTSRGDNLPIAQPLDPVYKSNSSTERIDNRSESDGEDGLLTDWSRSPSPAVGGSPDEVDVPRQSSTSHETWDAAQEMDPHAEEGEFARFVSQVKGRDLDDVRAEIDDEIKSLNQQRKAAMRDSEDITQQMISQIMVCGIAFIFLISHYPEQLSHS
jgi:DNA excision repair protein ERCC-5